MLARRCALHHAAVEPCFLRFEKTDAVKTVQKRLGCSNVLSDFYNIMLERHTDDDAGYDVLFVDPIRKSALSRSLLSACLCCALKSWHSCSVLRCCCRGNFASRLSHSCYPNCRCVVSVCVCLWLSLLSMLCRACGPVCVCASPQHCRHGREWKLHHLHVHHASHLVRRGAYVRLQFSNGEQGACAIVDGAPAHRSVCFTDCVTAQFSCARACVYGCRRNTYLPCAFVAKAGVAACSFALQTALHSRRCVGCCCSCGLRSGRESKHVSLLCA